MKIFEVIASTIHGLIRFRTPVGYGIVHCKPLVILTLTLIAEKRDLTIER